MKPLKFSIKVNCIDSYIYGGHLFLILTDGKIVFTQVSTIIRKLIQNYPIFENLIKVSFQRNDYLSNYQGQIFFGIGEIKRLFIELWERASSEMQFEIDFDATEFDVISEIPSMPVLDMRLYAMRMYLGCKEGLYETKLNPTDGYYLNPEKPKKKFDAKITNLNAKSGEIIISANSEGLYHGSFLNSQNELKVNDKPLAQKSIRTAWSNYDVINYEDQNYFKYFVNETESLQEKPIYSKFDENAERKRITQFGVSKYELDELLVNSELNSNNISYCFNSSQKGFFFTKDGHFMLINLNKKNKNNYQFTSRIHSLPNLENASKQYKRPISTSIVPNGCVVEYFDKVVLYQNNQAKIIETSPSINVRSYSNSIRYRNLISITKYDEITIHSIFPFDELPIQMTFDNFDFSNFL